jgi:uncharacterized protein
MARPLDRTHTIEMLIIQSTPFCNIDCSYCYLPNRSSKQRMSESTLARTFDRVFSSPFLADILTVLWHAGEPLVPGVGYYERAFEILESRRPREVAVNHHFQTNGTLLNQHWIEFFRKNQARVGVSLDGPPHLHDRNRKTRRQLGTFDQVMRGVQLLQDNNYPFHIISVLTRESLQAPLELFEFYLANGITNVAFNIEEIEGHHTTSSLHGVLEAEVQNFFRLFLNVMERNPGKVEVREFSGAFSGIVNREGAKYGNPMTEPMRTVSIGVNGDIGTFSPELLGYSSERHGAFAFGNIHKNELADVLQDPKFLLVNDEIQRGVERCYHTCDYFEVCRGGAPSNKIFENGTFNSTETLFCRLIKKAVIDVVLERIERDLESFKSG